MKRKRKETPSAYQVQVQVQLPTRGPKAARPSNGPAQDHTPSKGQHEKSHSSIASTSVISNGSGPSPSTPRTRRRGLEAGEILELSGKTIGEHAALNTVGEATRSTPINDTSSIFDGTASSSRSDNNSQQGNEEEIGDKDEEEEDKEEDNVVFENNLNENWVQESEFDNEIVDALIEGLESGPSTSNTPSKRAQDRPKGSHRKRSATPPQHLPPHEQYFFHNRPGGNKTSTNTLSSLSLLNHDQYFSLIREHVDPHQPERDFLHELHSRAFGQWRFELSEGFSICLYGWGSKRKLIMEYAEWMYASQNLGISDEEQQAKIVIVNGYVSNLSIKGVINIIATAFFGPNHSYRLGGQLAEMVDNLLALLTEHQFKPITLIIHCIDSPSLRRSATQSILSRLASHESIQLLASADHPSFPLLWDSSLRESFNFVFHDCTTFDPYEVEFDVVDSVNELLGRSGRHVGGKEGVGYVLKSLPENARNLYRVLVSEQLAGIEDGLITGDNDDERAGATSTGEGVEYRVLYQKAVEEFICSSEIAFRTLLKE